jgi:hypothetical protein
VVGHDAVDDAFGEPTPQQLGILSLADRWAALELCGAVRHLLGGEREVVRAGLHGDRGAAAACRGEGRKGVRAGEMKNVDAAARRLRHRDHPVYREVLGSSRTGVQEGLIRGAAHGWSTVDDDGVLGVHQHQAVERGDLAECLVQLQCPEVAELVDSGRNQEALEAENTGLVKRA